MTIVLYLAVMYLIAFLAERRIEEAYLLTMMGLFVPLILRLSSLSKNGRAAVASMLTGTLARCRRI